MQGPLDFDRWSLCISHVDERPVLMTGMIWDGGMFGGPVNVL